MTISSDIRLIAQTLLEEGTSGRFVCPICHGGSSGAKDFSITRANGMIFYRCFRDNCGIRGTIKGEGADFSPRIPRKRREYLHPLRNLKDQDIEFFEEKFGLQLHDLMGVRWCIETKRYLLPIYGPHGNLRGTIARTFDGRVPKADTFISNVEEPFIGWILPHFEDLNPDSVVVVEDWFSAAKVAKAGGKAVTLNGTHISMEMALELGDNADNVILALDAGTLPTMLKWVNLYKGIWKSYKIWKLTKDLKYEPIIKIRDAITNREKTFIGSPEGSDSLRGNLQ